MAGKEGSKYFNVFLNYEISLKNNEGQTIITELTFNLLKRIKEEKSLVAAAEKCNISFKTAWTKIGEVEKKLDFKIVSRNRGGAKGGQTILTKEGENLLLSFTELKKEFEISVKSISKKFFNRINEFATINN